MPWRLTHADKNVPEPDRPIGAVWAAQYNGESGYLVMLPGGDVWHTRQFKWDRARNCLTDQRWAVTMPGGDPLRMTVSPSIDVKDGWHGWIKDGVISDA